VSLTSTLSTLSGCSEVASSGGRPDSSQASMPHVPQPDYDAADSGTGDSDNDDITPTISRIDLSCRSGNNEFGNKELSGWTPGDVCDWLDSLQF
uniref:Uncharacterized protein n=1 Tax=Plectus sambesii TaxID=2011161 RepID=A0A914VDR1_9BILA